VGGAVGAGDGAGKAVGSSVGGAVGVLALDSAVGTVAAVDTAVVLGGWVAVGAGPAGAAAISRNSQPSAMPTIRVSRISGKLVFRETGWLFIR
jgi:hypothetical protein